MIGLDCRYDAAIFAANKSKKQLENLRFAIKRSRLVSQANSKNQVKM